MFTSTDLTVSNIFSIAIYEILTEEWDSTSVYVNITESDDKKTLEEAPTTNVSITRSPPVKHSNKFSSSSSTNNLPTGLGVGSPCAIIYRSGCPRVLFWKVQKAR